MHEISVVKFLQELWSQVSEIPLHNLSDKVIFCMVPVKSDPSNFFF